MGSGEWTGREKVTSRLDDGDTSKLPKTSQTHNTTTVVSEWSQTITADGAGRMTSSRTGWSTRSITGKETSRISKMPPRRRPPGPAAQSNLAGISPSTHVESFLHYLAAERGMSTNTISAYWNDLRQFT